MKLFSPGRLTAVMLAQVNPLLQDEVKAHLSSFWISVSINDHRGDGVVQRGVISILLWKP